MAVSINVSLFACTAHRFASRKWLTMYASAASCRVRRAVGWNYNSAPSLLGNFPHPLHEGQLLDKETCEFFLHLQISCRATVPSLNLLLSWGEPRCLWVLPLPTFFLLLSLLWPLSTLSPALSTIFPSLYLGYISYYLCTQLLRPFCCLFFFFLDNDSFEFKLSKKHSIMPFCRPSCHVPNVIFS